jgi:RimJ/RimL family protein N-acetyltransferase
MDLRNPELISHSNVSKWLSLPTIVAGRVTLRWINDSDESSLYTMFSDPEVMRYWSSPPLKDKDETKRLLDRIREGFQARRFFQWGIARNSDNRLIGTLTLFYLDSKNLRAEIGYALTRSEWGKGYMREALQTLLGFAFQELNLQRIEADVDPRNAPSIELLQGLGFQQEGVLRERWRSTGEVQDSAIYGLLRREWTGDDVNYRTLWPPDGGAASLASIRSRRKPVHFRLRQFGRRSRGKISALLTTCWQLIVAMFN